MRGHFLFVNFIKASGFHISGCANNWSAGGVFGGLTQVFPSVVTDGTILNVFDTNRDINGRCPVLGIQFGAAACGLINPLVAVPRARFGISFEPFDKFGRRNNFFLSNSFHYFNSGNAHSSLGAFVGLTCGESISVTRSLAVGFSLEIGLRLNVEESQFNLVEVVRALNVNASANDEIGDQIGDDRGDCYCRKNCDH